MEYCNEFTRKIAFLREDQNDAVFFGDIGVGWQDIIEKLLEELQLLQDDGLLQQITVDQVKEKFGGLRVYLTLEGAEEGYTAGHDLCNTAERASLECCEFCGKPGSPRGTVGCWIKTLCGEHHHLALEKGSYDV